MSVRNTLLAAAACAASFLSVPALAQETYTLRLAETWGPNSPHFG